MELINEHIHIDKQKAKIISETICLVRKDASNLYLTYTLGTDCLIDFSSAVNKVSIQIANAYFEKYGQMPHLSREQYNVCCNAQAKLYELINCNFTGLTRNVFLESIVLYLVFQTQKYKLENPSLCESCTIVNKPIELEKIQKAKNFIIHNLHQSLTIPVIANQVGTNQCYLKKGFKETTGQTIFEFVQENRMVKAKHMIQKIKTPIQEVANAVGYASISSFSQTYKSYYGISPSLEQKQIFPNN